MKFQDFREFLRYPSFDNFRDIQEFSRIFEISENLRDNPKKNSEISENFQKITKYLKVSENYKFVLANLFLRCTLAALMCLLKRGCCAYVTRSELYSAVVGLDPEFRSVSL